MREKLIDGFNGQYSIAEDGTVKNTVTGNIIKPYYNNAGHTSVNIGTKETGGRRNRGVALLVANAFIPKPKDLGQNLYVSHKDGNKRNNNVENLEWAKYSSKSSSINKAMTQRPIGKTFYKWTKSSSLIRSDEQFKNFIEGGSYYLIRKNAHKYKRGDYNFYEFIQVYIKRDDKKMLKQIAKNNTGKSTIKISDLIDNIENFLHWKYSKTLPSSKIKLAELYGEYTKKYKCAKKYFIDDISLSSLSKEDKDKLLEAYIFEDSDFYDKSYKLYSTDTILDEAKDDNGWQKYIYDQKLKKKFEFIEWDVLKRHKYILNKNETH